MDLGPQTDVYPCPTCGVDAARAMVVAAVVAFYKPAYVCPKCRLSLFDMQSAANHLASHEPDLGRFVDNWIVEHHPGYDVWRKGP